MSKKKDLLYNIDDTEAIASKKSTEEIVSDDMERISTSIYMLLEETKRYASVIDTLSDVTLSEITNAIKIMNQLTIRAVIEAYADIDAVIFKYIPKDKESKE